MHVFLARPMTGLDEKTYQHCTEINHAIASSIESVIDPTFEFYDPSYGFDPTGDCSDVYRDDEHMIFWADLLVINQFCYADGIGMLANEAANHGIPIISVVPRGLEISPMYSGMPVRTWRKIVYESLDDLKGQISGTLADIIRSVRLRSKQRQKVNEIGGHPGKQLLRCRIAHSIMLEELSLRTGLSPESLHRIENDPSGFLRLPHTMVWTISQAMGADAQIQSCCTSIRLPDISEDLNLSHVRESLTNLVDFVHGNSHYRREHDAAVIRCWTDYAAVVCSLATREAAVPGGHGRYQKVVQVAEWGTRIQIILSRLC